MKALTSSLLGLFAAPVLAGLLGAYVPLASAAPPKEIRIAVPDVSAGSSHSGGGVVDVLYTRQLLEKEFANDGITVKWSFFKGAGPVVNEAFANGQVDFAYLGDLAAIIGKSGGLDSRLLAATARGVNHYLGVQPGSGIKTLEDLKGKRVGIFRGTASQLSFDNALASVGLSEKDLKVINLDFSAALSALAARQIDATWGLAGLFALRDRGLAEIPLSTRDLDGAGTAGSGRQAGEGQGRGASGGVTPSRGRPRRRRFVAICNMFRDSCTDPTNDWIERSIQPLVGDSAYIAS